MADAPPARPPPVRPRRSSISRDTVSKNSVKEGMLLKRGGRRHSWNQRWVVLTASRLCFYKNAMDGYPNNVVNLAECSVSWSDDRAEQAFCLKLHTPTRTWFIAFETETSGKEWFDALINVKTGLEGEENSKTGASIATGDVKKPFEGYMLVLDRRSGLFGTKEEWRRAFVVVNWGTLGIYNSPMDAYPRDAVPLSGTVFKRADTRVGREFVIEAFNPSKTLFIQAETEVDADRWIAKLKESQSHGGAASPMLQSAGDGPTDIDLPTKEGFVSKLGLFRKWDSVWMVVYQRCAYFFKGSDQSVPFFVLSLSRCKISSVDDESVFGKKFCIQLLLSTSKTVIAVDDATAQRAWEEVLHQASTARDAGKAGAAAAMQGFMRKVGGRHKSVKRRWFELVEDKLYYFSSMSDHVPLGVVKLTGASVSGASARVGEDFAIEVDTADRTWFFICDDLLTHRAWLDAISAATTAESSSDSGSPGGSTAEDSSETVQPATSRGVSDHHTIDFGALEEHLKQPPVGAGAFGEVFLGMYLRTPVAIKRVPRRFFTGESMQELELVKACRHDNIVMYRGICFQEDYVYIVTEFCGGGDLLDLLKDSKRKIPWSLRLRWAKEIVLAMIYLHYDRGVVHRDLKATNLLLTDKNQIKVSDFGLATCVDLNRSLDTAGTFCYMAPELLQMGKKNGDDVKPSAAEYKVRAEKADVFSFGVVLVEIITRLDSEHGIPRSNDFGIATDELAADVPRDTPVGFLELALDCCSVKRAERPVFSEVLDRLLLVEAQFSAGPVEHSLDQEQLYSVSELELVDDALTSWSRQPDFSVDDATTKDAIAFCNRILKDSMDQSMVKKLVKDRVVAALGRLEPPSEIFVDGDWRLYLGSVYNSEDWKLLKGLGVSAILNVTNDLVFVNEREFRCHRIAVEDTPMEDIGSRLDEGVRFLANMREQSRSVLVHCQRGVSRSATVCAAYLCAQTGMKDEDSIRYLVERRRIVDPNPGFRQQLKDWLAGKQGCEPTISA